MYDTNNLDSEYCCNTPAEQQWVEAFQQDTLQLISQLPPSNPVYSSVCLVHCLSSNADWYEFTVNGVSLSQAVGTWFFSAQDDSVVGQCTGWDCTTQCSGGPWMPTNTPCPTTTNVCANSYMFPPSGPGSEPPTQADIAAWNAQNLANNQNAQSQFEATGESQSGNPVGTVGDSEPALTAPQQQAVAAQGQGQQSQQQQQCEEAAAQQLANAQQHMAQGNTAAGQLLQQQAQAMAAACAQMTGR